ncbi:MAG: hypothetical protein QM736_15600 [Vicinamibacterales bacterium]
MRQQAESRFDGISNVVVVAGLDCVDDLVRLASHVDCDLYVTVLTCRSPLVDRFLSRLRTSSLLTPLLLLVNRDVLPHAIATSECLRGPISIAPFSTWTLERSVECAAKRRASRHPDAHDSLARAYHAWTPGSV